MKDISRCFHNAFYLCKFYHAIFSCWNAFFAFKFRPILTKDFHCLKCNFEVYYSKIKFFIIKGVSSRIGRCRNRNIFSIVTLLYSSTKNPIWDMYSDRHWVQWRTDTRVLENLIYLEKKAPISLDLHVQAINLGLFY